MSKKIFVAIVISILGASIANANAGKVLICHKTSSEKNPIVLISVSSNAVQAHLSQGDTLLPAGETDCSGGGPSPE